MVSHALRLAATARAEARPARPRAVHFRVTRRIDVRRLNWWQRLHYVLVCRSLTGRWRTPGAIPADRGSSLSFAEADEACQTPDDQLHVLPLGVFYDGDTIHPDIVCRPRDKSDEANYLALREEYGDEDGYAEGARLEELCDRLAALEARVSALSDA